MHGTLGSRPWTWGSEELAASKLEFHAHHYSCTRYAQAGPLPAAASGLSGLGTCSFQLGA